MITRKGNKRREVEEGEMRDASIGNRMRDVEEEEGRLDMEYMKRGRERGWEKAMRGREKPTHKSGEIASAIRQRTRTNRSQDHEVAKRG